MWWFSGGPDRLGEQYRDKDDPGSCFLDSLILGLVFVLSE